MNLPGQGSVHHSGCYGDYSSGNSSKQGNQEAAIVMSRDGVMWLTCSSGKIAGATEGEGSAGKRRGVW